MTTLKWHALGLALSALIACSNDADDPPASGNDAGDCDGGACRVDLEEFQNAALNCPETYEAAEDEWVNTADDCVYAFFECEGLQGAAYQYGFTGDNVQCYFDDSGALVGGIRTSDHGQNTIAGELPAVSCYGGPICG